MPSGNEDIILENMLDMKGIEMQEAKGGGYKVRLALPEAMAEKGLIAKYIDKPI